MLAVLALGLLLMAGGATVLARLAPGPGLVVMGAGVVCGVVARAWPRADTLSASPDAAGTSPAAPEPTPGTGRPRTPRSDRPEAPAGAWARSPGRRPQGSG